MPYFPDLTTYVDNLTEDLADLIELMGIEPGPPIDPQLNVGWLSIEHEFPKLQTPQAFRERLWTFAAYRVLPSRGIHTCDICNQHVHHNDPLIGTLGSAEIRVRGIGCWYACPNLIAHYVEAHDYRPPDDFIDAVMKSPAPFTPEYERELDIVVLSFPLQEPVRPNNTKTED